MPVPNSIFLKVPTVILRASKMPEANSRVSQVPAMIVALLWLLPQPRHNSNILQKRSLATPRGGLPAAPAQDARVSYFKRILLC